MAAVPKERDEKKHLAATPLGMTFFQSFEKGAVAGEEGCLFRKLIATNDSVATTVLRLALGVVFFAHGAQKMLGWFGGPGFSGTMGFFTGTMHIPAVFAFLAIMAEFLGGIGLLLGFLTRIAAFGIGVNMLVAILTVHRFFGFFMNWGGNQKGEGFEFHTLVLAIVAYLLIKGAGALSVDHALSSEHGVGAPAPRAA